MLRGWWLAGAVLGLAIAFAAFYTTRLSYAPIYLIHDEVKFSLQAESIAASGRDLNGRVLPLYFAEPEFRAGRDPVMIYTTALALKVLPLSQFSVRVPTALVGVLNGVLMFIVARRLFGSDLLGLVAAALLAFTPGHFIHSRLALSILYPIPFILGWLWCLNQFVETGRRLALIAAGTVLGLSIYSYLGSVVMAPIYLLFTIGAVLHGRDWREWKRTTPAVVGFAVALLPALLWQIAYPDRVTELLTGYRVPGSGHTLGESLGNLLSGEGLRMRVALYWSFFSPAFLFIAGDSSALNSTRGIGFFPIVFAVLLPVGLFQIAWRRGWPVSLAIAGGFLSAPLAGVLSGELEANRILYVLPFGALVAACGVQGLLEARSRIVRFAAIVLLAAVPLQFAAFYADYMGSYRTRTSFWYGGNLAGTFDGAIKRSPPAIYVSQEIPYADAYWRFTAISAGHPELIDRPTYVTGTMLPDAPTGALIVCSTSPKSCEAVRASNAWTAASATAEPNGDTMFEVFQRR